MLREYYLLSGLVPQGGGATPLPEPYTGNLLLLVDLDDFGLPAGSGIRIKATILSPGPFSLDGKSFQVDAVQYSGTGASFGLDPIDHPDPENGEKRYLPLPESKDILDRFNTRTTRYRFDSIGARQPNGRELIDAQIVTLTAANYAAAGGSLWKLLATT